MVEVTSSNLVVPTTPRRPGTAASHMDNCIDGFVYAFPVEHLQAYRKLVDQVAQVWLEHGALSYQEFTDDGKPFAGTRDLAELLGAGDTQVVIFGWVAFASSEARDHVCNKVANDPRMPSSEVLAELGFSARNMAFGRFSPFVVSSVP